MTTGRANNKRGIFIVDDHPLVREWLSNLINQQSDLAVCGEAATAREAVKVVAAAKPEVAIVDISLKDSSGLELIKDLKTTCPDVAVLVLSMHDEGHYAERALVAGARGYITKRETTKNVVEAIRSVLAGRFYLSEAVAQAVISRYVEGQALASQSPAAQLSDRESAVFDMLGQGQGTRQIGETLGVSIKTVQSYCARIKEKLNLRNGTELLREAVRSKEMASQE